MKWLIGIVLGLLVLVAVLVGVGFLLPSEFKIERSVLVQAPAEKVYPLIAVPREWSRWAVWNARDPAMQIGYSGPESGTGAAWSWQSKTEGNGEMVFDAAVPNERIDYSLSFPEFGMQSNGELRLEPAEGGVRVSWTNAGDMGGNPINRWFGLLMDSLVGPDFEAGLAKLKQVAEAG